MGLPGNAPLISVSDHLYEVPEMFADCRGDGAPHLITTDDDSQAWQFGSARIPLYHFPVPKGSPIPRRVEDLPDFLRDPQARLAAMDRDGAHTHLMFPHAMGFAGELLLGIADKVTRIDACRAYNDYVSGVYHAAASDRLLGVAVVPLADAEEAGTELRRAAKAGARGVTVPCSPAVIGLPSWHEDHWEPLLAAAEDCGVPLFIHVATMRADGSMVSHGSTPGGPLGALLTLYNLDVMTAVTEIGYSPILVRHPNLKIVTVEGGAAWFPYLCERIDMFWGNRGDLGKGPGTVRDRPPSDLLKRAVSMSFIEDPAAIRNRADVGIERMMWMGDFPHEDGFWPNNRAMLEELLRDVPEQEARAITSGNAARLLGLTI